VPVVAVSPEKAADRFGWLGMFAGLDLAASSAQTQKRLGWRSSGPGLIADLDGCAASGTEKEVSHGSRICNTYLSRPFTFQFPC
jgi:hypothetical protein